MVSDSGSSDPTSEAAEANPSSIDPNHTTVPVICFHSRTGSVWIFLILAAIAAGVVAGIIEWSGRTKTTPSSFLALVMVLSGALTLVLLSGAAINALRRLHNRRMDRMMASLDGPEWEASVTLSRSLLQADWRAIGSRMLLPERHRNWASLKRVIDAQPFPKPKVLVDSRLSQQCRDIGWTEELLDPESLDSRIEEDQEAIVVGRSYRKMLIPALLFSICAGGLNGWAGFFLVLFITLITYAFMAAWPILRPGMPRLKAAPIAAMGVIMDHRQRRWTSADSVLIVDPIEHDRQIIASLYGPAGRLILRFHETNDAGFAALWRHWVHPKPDFDLLTQFIDPRGAESQRH